MSDELKPCPFCGGKARYRTGVGVECSDCFASIVEARRLRESVFAEWNRRADAAALAEAQATIARLEAALREIAQEPMNGDLMEPIIKRNLATARAVLSPREGEG